MLCVLDAKPPVAAPLFVFQTLVKIQDGVVGAVADGMNRDLGKPAASASRMLAYIVSG